MEATPADPIPKSSGARQHAEESSAPSSGLGGGKKLAPTIDGSAAVPGTTVVATESSEADAGVADITLE